MQGEELEAPADAPNLLDSLRLDDRNSIEEIKVPQSFIRPILRDLNLRKKLRSGTLLAAGHVNIWSVDPPAVPCAQRRVNLLVVMGTIRLLKGFAADVKPTTVLA